MFGGDLYSIIYKTVLTKKIKNEVKFKLFQMGVEGYIRAKLKKEQDLHDFIDLIEWETAR